MMLSTSNQIAESHGLFYIVDVAWLDVIIPEMKTTLCFNVVFGGIYQECKHFSVNV